MISEVFWMFYVGVCLGSGWIAWAGSREDGNSTPMCVWAAVTYALLAPVIVGLTAAVLILRPVFRS